MATSEWLSTMRVGREATWGTPATCTYLIPLLNSVHIGPVAPTAIHTGHVRDGYPMLQERHSGQGRKAAAFTGAQTPATARVAQWLFANFAQCVVTTADPATDLVQPLDYTGMQVNGSGGSPAGCPYTFQKAMNALAADSIEMAGGLITRLRLEAPQLGSAVFTFDGIGEDEAQPSSIVGSPTVLTDTVLCTKDLTFKWAGSSHTPITLDIEFKNNGIYVWRQGVTPIALLRGILEVSGSATFDWESQDTWTEAAARTPDVASWQIYWGTTGNDGYLNIAVDGKIVPTPSQTPGDEVERITLNFQGLLKTSGPSSWDVTTNSPYKFDFAT